MAKTSKKLKAAYEAVDRNRAYPLAEAVALVKVNASSKFDETIEIAMNLSVDPRHADQMVRGVVAMPNGTGKTMRVAVFAKDAKADEAKAAGADLVGADDLGEAIQNGTATFDRVIATPDMMPIVGRLGKVLGPRNLMPNPKVGTVTMDVKKAVSDVKGGKIDFKVDKTGIVHASIGKASFDALKIQENADELLKTIMKLKPSTTKGTYVKSIFMSSTMSPSISIDTKIA